MSDPQQAAMNTGFMLRVMGNIESVPFHTEGSL